MLRHRVYRLESTVSMLGVELSDWYVMLFSWLVFKQGFAALVGNRLSLLIAAIGTFLVFKVWRQIKDKLPQKFMPHLLTWLSEAEVYVLAPDPENTPLTVKLDKPNPEGVPYGVALEG